VKVTFFATLRQIVGQKVVDFDLEKDANVQDLLDEMLRKYPGLQTELINENGGLFDHVHIFVNGRDASFLSNGMLSILNPNDTVGIFPAVGGG
jgi:molybdopterin synthase sulfur carrier subunit